MLASNNYGECNVSTFFIFLDISMDHVLVFVVDKEGSVSIMWVVAKIKW